MSDAEKRIEEALAYIDRAVWASNAEAVGRLHSILQPPPRVHVFAGVRFVEDELRPPERGEYYLDSDGDLVWCWQGTADFEVIILRYAPEEQLS